MLSDVLHSLTRSRSLNACSCQNDSSSSSSGAATMSFFRNRWSLRGKRGSYNLGEKSPSRRPQSMAMSEGTPKIPSGLIQCHVTLLDDSTYTCLMNVSCSVGLSSAHLYNTWLYMCIEMCACGACGTLLYICRNKVWGAHCLMRCSGSWICWRRISLV